MTRSAGEQQKKTNEEAADTSRCALIRDEIPERGETLMRDWQRWDATVTAGQSVSADEDFETEDYLVPGIIIAISHCCVSAFC